jgi:hypothetical protein
MCSGRSDTPLRVPSFLIRTSTDRSLVGSSPWLIAASHVLLRLQAPRHPPLALRSLKTEDARARYGILKGRAPATAETNHNRKAADGEKVLTHLVVSSATRGRLCLRAGIVERESIGAPCRANPSEREKPLPQNGTVKDPTHIEEPGGDLRGPRRVRRYPAAEASGYRGQVIAPRCDMSRIASDRLGVHRNKYSRPLRDDRTFGR